MSKRTTVHLIYRAAPSHLLRPAATPTPDRLIKVHRLNGPQAGAVFIETAKPRTPTVVTRDERRARRTIGEAYAEQANLPTRSKATLA